MTVNSLAARMPYLNDQYSYKPICVEVLICTYKQTDDYLWDIFKLNFSDFYDTYNKVQW